jgi:uncharacterized protein
MSEDVFAGLREKLNHDKNWPRVYLFKFIVPNDNQKLAQAEALFGSEAQVKINQSRTGKYLSISATELMISAEEIIERYKKAGAIEGLTSL